MQLEPESANEAMALRLLGDRTQPALVYLPGIHGDWTLNGGLRAALNNRVHFAEFTYPRTLTASLSAYAQAADNALAAAGLTEGWLLAESFGSQVAWAFLSQPRRFAARGLVLAGGFVRHPFRGGVRCGRWAFARAPLRWVWSCTRGFVALARLRDRRAGITDSELEIFLARRTEADRQAAVHRLGLILDHDWRAIASTVRIPVYYLTGLFDPIVPWPCVAHWLSRHCLGFRGWRLLVGSDHHVLGWTPRVAANQILNWMTTEAGTANPPGSGRGAGPSEVSGALLP